MRLTTLASIVVLSVSTAALAQVASTPVEQKIPADNTAAPDDMVRNANTAAPANDLNAAPGAPSTALVNTAATDTTSTSSEPK